MSLMFSKGHGKATTCAVILDYVEKLLEATQVLMMVDYVREMILKNSCMVSMDCLSICSSGFFTCISCA